MTRRRTYVVVGLVALVLGGAALGAAARLTTVLARVDAPAPLQVPTRWKQARESLGHMVHLETRELKCRDCHATVDANGFVAPTVVACARCHGEHTSTIHTSPLAAAAADCLTCHDFSGDRGVVPWACARCHEAGDEQTGTKVAHHDLACGTCHRPHDTPSLAPGDCRSCHDDQAPVAHGKRAIGGATTCLACHESHDQSIAASRRCETCHRPERGAVSLVAGAGHARCVDCHTGHDFTSKGALACQSCHEGRRVLGAAEARAHRDCKSCHPPHDIAGARARCVSCHARVPTAHPAVREGAQAQAQAQASCVSCHPAHPARNAVLAAKGTVSCQSCHAPKIVAKDDRSAHAGDVACTTCHAPHGRGPIAAAAGAATCVRCHDRETSATRHTTGHRDCLTCHTGGAHAPTRPPPKCTTCHETQATTAPAGHQTCAACHLTHDGRRKREATCAAAGCHADRATGPHVKLTGGCATCHRAHGPKGVAEPPGCLDCHTRGALPQLHQRAGHEGCASCHTAHAPAPLADRATCLRCHEEQRDHEPTAKICSGCHLFGDGR